MTLLPELVISTGDPQGVGPEVAVKAARAAAAEGIARCVLVGAADVLREAGADAAWPRLAGVAAVSDAPLSVLVAPPTGPFDAPPPSAAGGRAAMAALDLALDRVADDPRRALATAPLAKDAVRLAGVAGFDGHTGYVARRFGAARPVMLFATPTFRVALATVHVPLRRVPELVTTELLVGLGRVVAGELRARFRVASPRLDFLGLNPHAGERGAFGDEDDRAVAPAVRALNAEGVVATGPHPADSYFLEGFETRADCVVAMYHDQGLVAVKSLAFKTAVNVTLGLPIVRTSPDHGTAFALRGLGTADAGPMLASLRLAARLARNR